MTDFDFRLEAAGALLTATGTAAPVEALQVASAVAGIAVCLIAIVKAGIKVYDVIRGMIRGDITPDEAVEQLDDVREEIADDLKGGADHVTKD